MQIIVKQIEHRFYADGSARWDLIFEGGHVVELKGRHAKEIVMKFNMAKQPEPINKTVKSSTKLTVYK